VGVLFGESPGWHDDRLWFADWGRRELIALIPMAQAKLLCGCRFRHSRPSASTGCRTEAWSSSRHSMDFSTPCARWVVGTDADPGGLSLGAWNEVVVDGRGNCYVNGGGSHALAGEEFAQASLPSSTGLRLRHGARAQTYCASHSCTSPMRSATTARCPSLSRSAD
jgi:hypothetical protein